MAVPSYLELPAIFVDLQLPLLCLNNIVALAIGPRHQLLRVSISLPVLVLLTSQSLFRKWNGTWGIHYGINCMVLMVLFEYVDWILLSSPDKEKWHKIQYNKPGATGTQKEPGKANGLAKRKEEDVVPVGFLSRFWWGVRLATTKRYVGWSCQVKNVPTGVDSDYSRV